MSIKSKLDSLFSSKDKESEKEIDNVDNKEVKETVLGKFKPKRKFLNFVAATNNNVRILQETAFIEGSKLSGVLEGAKFKVTICDEGTIDFVEVDTNLSDESMIKRLIESIDEMDSVGYAQKFIVSNLEFQDKSGNRCYLEIEKEKPIDKLRSILDEETKSPELSDKGFSILDALFTSDTDEELEREFEGENDFSEKDVEVMMEAIDNPSEPNDELKKASKSYLEESFKKMNESKIKELEDRIQSTLNEISKYNFEVKSASANLEKEKENLSILESRLESLKPGEEPNGYYFNVSELNKSKIDLGEKTKEIASKISSMMGLKKEAIFENLKDGYYTISIGSKSGDDEEISEEIISKIASIDPLGKITAKKNQFNYSGDLTWHQLVGKMIKMGFEQNEEFDKKCGSNSYDEKGTDVNKF